jgi:phosphohistidine phosphatase SixA
MATYLWRSEIRPDLVICSTATRAMQTLDPIVKAVNPPKIILERKIYGGITPKAIAGIGTKQ